MSITRTPIILLTVAALGVAGGFLISESRHVPDPVGPVVETPEAGRGLQPAPTAPTVTPEVASPTEAPTAPPAAVREAPQTTRTAARTEPTRPQPDWTVPDAASRPDPISFAVPPIASAPPVPADAAPVALEPPAAPIRRIELVIEEDSVIGIRLDEAISSATAKVEDRVSAVVSRDVVVDGRMAVPSGSRVEGYVAFVEEGGKFREKARIGLRFTTLVLPSAERVPIVTETVFREGESPTAEATSKIGASAVVGTVLGAIIGGKKGAAIGGAAGAAGGTAVVAKGKQNEAALGAGSLLTLRLVEPAVVTVDRD